MTLPVIIYAESDYKKPRYTLLDKDKKPVIGVGQFNDDTRCVHEAGKLPTGKYYCAQEPIPITVINDAIETNNTLLTWTAPIQNTDGSELTDLVGFKIYYGESESNLSTVVNIDNPTTTKFETSSLPSNTCCFAVTPVNSLGIEGKISNIASKKVL